MGNPWTDLVKQKFDLGKKINASYSLKDAMIEAKKFYKKGSALSASVSAKMTGKRRNKRGGSKKRRSSKTRRRR
jgi:hypothetical protein